MLSQKRRKLKAVKIKILTIFMNAQIYTKMSLCREQKLNSLTRANQAKRKDLLKLDRIFAWIHWPT